MIRSTCPPLQGRIHKMAQKRETRGSLEQRHRCLRDPESLLGTPRGAEWSGFLHTLCFLLLHHGQIHRGLRVTQAGCLVPTALPASRAQVLPATPPGSGAADFARFPSTVSSCTTRAHPVFSSLFLFPYSSKPSSLYLSKRDISDLSPYPLLYPVFTGFPIKSGTE